MEYFVLNGEMRLYTLLPALLVALDAARAEDWPRFRGPNGAGVSQSRNLPAEIGEGSNVVWKRAAGAGHSSPVVLGGKLFFTAEERGRLWVIALSRENGKELWRRQCPRDRTEPLDKRNSAASPTPAGPRRGIGGSSPGPRDRPVAAPGRGRRRGRRCARFPAKCARCDVMHRAGG